MAVAPDESIAKSADRDVGKSWSFALVISAEVDVPHGRVLQFVDLARRSGGTRFAIKAEQGIQTP